MDAPKPIKSVWGDKIFPKTVHVDQAVIRFPNGVESGNWQTRPTDDTREYILATEHARIVAEKDARIARLREACNQSRLAFAGYVSAQSAIDALDRSALKGDDNG